MQRNDGSWLIVVFREVPSFRANDVADHATGGGHSLSTVRSPASNWVSISNPESEPSSSAPIDQRKVTWNEQNVFSTLAWSTRSNV